MNEHNEQTNSRVAPYRATANLNTAIGNPSVNINDTMNINIQTMATNSSAQNSINQNYSSEQTTSQIKSQVNPNTQVQNPANFIANSNTGTNQNNQFMPNTSNYNQVMTNANNNTQAQNTINNNNITGQNNAVVKKTYVSSDNKPKKKSITFNVGPEFKIAILIIVILLVFVFLLPVISDLLGGY